MVTIGDMMEALRIELYVAHGISREDARLGYYSPDMRALVEADRDAAIAAAKQAFYRTPGLDTVDYETSTATMGTAASYARIALSERGYSDVALARIREVDGFTYISAEAGRQANIEYRETFREAARAGSDEFHMNISEQIGNAIAEQWGDSTLFTDGNRIARRDATINQVIADSGQTFSATDLGNIRLEATRIARTEYESEKAQNER